MSGNLGEPVHFAGPGQWRSRAEEAQAGTRPPDAALQPRGGPEVHRAGFDEARHPRDKAGKFAKITGAPSSPATWEQDWSPPEAGGWVPDLTPAPGVKELTSGGRDAPPATGTAADPIDVHGDLDKALDLMRDGKHVRLNQVNEVATLLHKVAEISKNSASAKDRPNWDFGLLSVTGTNLFTAQHKGIPRINMPQFSGLAEPGTEAAKLAGGAGKFVDLGPQLAEALKAKGVKVTTGRVLAGHLRATQTELVGGKVAGFASAVEHGDPGAIKALGEPIFVTRDHYVVDGHHRWAANMMLDALDGTLGNDTYQNVSMIDMDIGAMIPYANEFTARMGIAGRGGVKKAVRALLTRVRLDGASPGDRVLLRQAAGMRDIPAPWRAEITAFLTKGPP
jgi:hypothetical protein